MIFSKKNLSIILLSSFVCTTIFFYYLNFQQENSGFYLKKQNLGQVLIKESDFLKFQELKFLNANGEFRFSKKNADSQLWSMDTPQQNMANELFFNQLYQLLTTSKIKKIIPLSDLNLKTYLLDRPKTTLTFSDSNKEKFELIIGLANTIDNSIYLKTSNRQAIFYLDLPSGFALTNYNLSDLIESRIFPSLSTSWLSFKIRKHHSPTQSILEYSFINESGKIILEQKNDFSNIIIADFFKKMTDFKADFVLNDFTSNQKNIFSQLNKKIFLQLSLKSFSIKSSIIENAQSTSPEEQIENWTIYNPINNFPEVDLKSEFYYLIHNHRSDKFYLVRKNALDLLFNEILI